MIEEINNLPSLQETVEKYNLSPKKSLGQNFLFDMNITNKIARIAGNLEQGSVIEIGSGPGGLTRALLLNKANLTCIEADERAVKAISPLKKIAGEKLTVINQDATNTDITKIGSMPRQVVANLPYNVGTLLLMKWLETPQEFTKFTLMFQKEVAQRITAQTGDKNYGRLAYFVIYYVILRLKCFFSITFTPPPKVESAVVSLIVRNKPLYPVNIKTLTKITKFAFGQRRKMIKASLKQLNVDVTKLLDIANIDPKKRAEELTISDFCNISNVFDNNF